MKKIIEKSLAVLIASHLLFSPLVFAEDEENKEDTQTSKITDQTTPEFKDIEIPVESQQYIEKIRAMATGGEASDLDVVQNQINTQYQKRIAQQQENMASSTTAFDIPISIGTTLSVNPCYPCTNSNKICQNPNAYVYPGYNTNNGVANYGMPVMACNVQYTRSDGGEVTADNVAMATIQSSRLTGNMSNLSATMYTLLNSDISNSAKFALMLQSLISDMDNREIVSAAQYQAEENAKAEKRMQQNDSVNESFQKARSVVSDLSGNAPCTIKLTPAVPSIEDNANVEVTLIPKNKEKKGKYSITLTFKDLSTGELVTREAVENIPTVVELGEWQRYPGTREVAINYRDVDTGQVLRSTFTYNVTQAVSVLTGDGKTVNNSVVGAIANLDIYANNGQTFEVIGKILNATYDRSKGTCVMTVADENINNGQQATIESKNIAESDCGKSVGTYIRMEHVKANMDSSGNITLEDAGGTSQTVFGKSQSEYADYQSLSDNVHKNSKSKNDYDVLQMSGNDYIYGNYGKIGSDFVILPGGVRLSVKYCSEEEIAAMTGLPKENVIARYMPLKSDGSPYPPAEFAEIQNRSGLDLSRVKYDADENGNCVIKDGDSVVSRFEYTSADIAKGVSQIMNANASRLNGRAGELTVIGAMQQTASGMGAALTI